MLKKTIQKKFFKNYFQKNIFFSVKIKLKKKIVIMTTLRRSSGVTSSFLKTAIGDQPQETKWSISLILTVALLISSATFMLMGYKVQGKQYNYNHGLMQTFQMFLGEWLNLIIFFIIHASNKKYLNSIFSKMKSQSKISKSKMKYSKLWMAIPSLLDSMGSSLGISSLLLIPASVNSMLGGASIIASAIISRFFFNRKIHRHHFLGCISTFIGFALVGVSSVMNSKNSSTSHGSTTGTILGITMQFLAVFFSSLQANIQELIFRKLEIPPQREIGLEGFYGLIWIFIWLMIFSFIPCPNEELCSIGRSLDDPVTGLIDILNNSGLQVWVVLTALSMAIVNWTNISLVKNVSCMFSAFMGTMTTVTVWFVSLAVGYEKFDLVVSGIQLVGFLFLVFGNFVYNEIIEIKFCGLNKKMSKYLGNGEVVTGVVSLGVDSKEDKGD